MNRGSLLALLAGIMLCASAGAQQIHLKTRDIQTSAANPSEESPRAARFDSTHKIVQFDRQPGAAEIGALIDSGFTVVSAIPDNALLVSGRGAVRQPGVIWQRALEPSDKISPVIVPDAGASIQVIVEFHGDVSEVEQNAIGSALGFDFARPGYLLPNHVLVSASILDLRMLAARDEVAYIFPADPNAVANEQIIACAGMLTLAGPIAQYANVVHGWDLDSDHMAHLGYYLGALTPKVPEATVKSEILRAMNAWTAVANVTFSASTSETALRTIALKFASGAHGDSKPFDGAGGIVGHTFYPTPVNAESIAGDLHLDADENWHAGSDLDLYSVVLHEMGHALGLGHTDKPGDVMYPYYRRGMTLSQNDIGAVQALYGAPAAAATTTATPPPTPLTPVLQLTFNPPLPPGSAAITSISGTLSGGVAPLSGGYQTSGGGSGNITIDSTGNWNAANVPLLPGPNTITVTVYDATKSAASASVTVSRVVNTTTSSTPVAIRISTPAAAVSATRSASVSVAGTASSGNGIVQVTWQTSTGSSGSATGTNQWVASIPLLTGTNTIILRAYDASGSSGWASLVVVKQ